MSPRTLLVLAASRYQLEAIRTARRLGCRVVTTDNVPGNPGHAEADRAFPVDTTDVEGVLALARTEQISGVLAPCTDVAVHTAAVVAQRLGLPGPPPDAARVLTDKIRFRGFQKDRGWPCPECHVLEAGVLPAEVDWAGAPWLLKPAQASGSRGIFIVRNAGEAAGRIPETFCNSPGGRALMERCIDGRQGTVEGILRGGRVELSFFLDRQTAPPPFVTTVGHRLPSCLPEAVRDRTLEQMEAVWRDLGVHDGVFDCDFVWDGREVYLLEMTPRLGGNSISKLIRHAAGVDLVEWAVGQALGEAAPVPRVDGVRPTALVLLGVWESGRLRYDPARCGALRRESWVHSLEMDVEPGTPVEPFVNGRHRIGEAYLTAAEARQLPELEARLLRELELGVERG